MKRIVTALAVAALVNAAGAARADWGPGAAAPGTSGASYPTPPEAAGGRPPERYGFLPGIKRLFTFGGGSKECRDCKPGLFSRGGQSSHPPHADTGPSQMPGTLAFPHHPFVRSPRDYFMAGEGGQGGR